MEGCDESGYGEGLKIVTMGGKGRGEIGGEAGEVTGVVADMPTTVFVIFVLRYFPFHVVFIN